MGTQLEEEKHDGEAFSPLDPEIVARLEARGVKVKTGAFDARGLPLPQRPVWLAFLIRLARRLR
jgi:hypothetical protein